MSGGMTNDRESARLSNLLDDLEYHRAFGVAARLEQAIRAEQEAIAAGATDQPIQRQRSFSVRSGDFIVKPQWSAPTKDRITIP